MQRYRLVSNSIVRRYLVAKSDRAIGSFIKLGKSLMVGVIAFSVGLLILFGTIVFVAAGMGALSGIYPAFTNKLGEDFCFILLPCLSGVLVTSCFIYIDRKKLNLVEKLKLIFRIDPN